MIENPESSNPCRWLLDSGFACASLRRPGMTKWVRYDPFHGIAILGDLFPRPAPLPAELVTACRPPAGASALRTDAAPGAAARISRQSSAPVGATLARGDTDRHRTVACHPAVNGYAAGAVDVTVADLDAETGVGITGAAVRDDPDAPAAVERRTGLRCIGRNCDCDCHESPNGWMRHHL